MAWRQPGDKPLSEPIMISLLTHYLNQCWNIVKWSPRNKLQRNFNRNSYNFIQENAFENVVCEMASIFLGLNVLINTLMLVDHAVSFVLVLSMTNGSDK